MGCPCQESIAMAPGCSWCDIAVSSNDIYVMYMIFIKPAFNKTIILFTNETKSSHGQFRALFDEQMHRRMAEICQAFEEESILQWCSGMVCYAKIRNYFPFMLARFSNWTWLGVILGFGRKVSMHSAIISCWCITQAPTTHSHTYICENV